MTRFKTVEDVWENMAYCDRRERAMVLYGPYDPRADEVMEGWRSAEYATLTRTHDEYRREAEMWSGVAAVGVDMSKVASPTHPMGYTAEELESDARLKESSSAWAKYLEIAAVQMEEFAK